MYDLPCTTLLNSEKCVLLENKKKKRLSTCSNMFSDFSSVTTRFVALTLPYNFTGCIICHCYELVRHPYKLYVPPHSCGCCGGTRSIAALCARWCHTHSMSISYSRPVQAQADVFRDCGGSSDILYLISRRLSVIIVRCRCPLRACLGRIFDQMINSKRACETDLRHHISYMRVPGVQVISNNIQTAHEGHC